MSDKEETGRYQRDVASIDPAQFPERPFPVEEERCAEAFRVVVKRSVLEAIRAHGLQSPNVEVCGVLVGEVFQYDARPFLYIEASIRGEHAGHDIAQVTFTSATWTHIHNNMDRHYPDMRIIGWYHTHPRFGIFLSNMDTFIQENFFNLSWQVAYVYDPCSDEEGLFIWVKDRLEKWPIVVEENLPKKLGNTVIRACPPSSFTAAVPTVTEEELAAGDSTLLIPERGSPSDHGFRLWVFLGVAILLLSIFLFVFKFQEYRLGHRYGPIEEKPSVNLVPRSEKAIDVPEHPAPVSGPVSIVPQDAGGLEVNSASTDSSQAGASERPKEDLGNDRPRHKKHPHSNHRNKGKPRGRRNHDRPGHQRRPNSN